MSKILEKPFSWANKIVQAIFRGAPNLITTSDLNRQIEALKKEMYVLQNSVGVVISDLAISQKSTGLDTSGSYVFCSGVRFEINLQSTVEFDVSSDESFGKELRLYAKKVLVTYEDDFSKEISGAKFEDGKTQPAADHYVYGEAKVEWVDSALPNSDLEYPQSADYEYICTLVRVVRKVFASDSNDYSGYYVENLTTSIGRGLISCDGTYGQFKRVQNISGNHTSKNDNSYIKSSLSAEDTVKGAIHKLWSRIYTLEKRFFAETTLPENRSPHAINGNVFDRNRSYTYEVTNGDFGTVRIFYRFYIVGNICFIQGSVNVEKNVSSNGTKTIIRHTPPQQQNSLPKALPGNVTGGANFDCLLNIVDTSEEDVIKNSDVCGFINNTSLCFTNIPAEGAKLGWTAVYCFDTENFWDFAKDDNNTFFNDRV